MFFNTVQSYVTTLVLSMSLKNFTAMSKFNRVSAHKYSKLIEGTDDHFDSKVHKEIRSHKTLTFWIVDGKHFLPLSSYFLFGKMLSEK